MTYGVLVVRIAEVEKAPTRLVSAPVWSGLTEKQERFALLVSDGLNYSAAYREVYDASAMSAPSIWREAHRVSRNQRVAARIADLIAERQQEGRLRAQTRASRIMAQLEELMASAKTDSGRLRAAELLGKSVGLFRDVLQTRNGGGETLAELEAKLNALITRNTG
ncbi:terminase small subunit [Jannaschia faecimaris]|nr:terminase small subunit [Jannaschia faecimaris]